MSIFVSTTTTNHLVIDPFYMSTTPTICQKILDIKAKGAAILLVSNELDEIEVLADSAVVMYEGKISKRITKDTKFRENIASKMLSGVHFTENING